MRFFRKKLFYGIIDRRKEYKREMEKDKFENIRQYIQILKVEFHPAMGCPEPIALLMPASGSQKRNRMSCGRVVIGASGRLLRM